MGTLAAILVAATAAAAPPAGARACTGCHGPVVGGPVVRLEGLPAAQITEAMRGFRTGERPGTVMGRIAKGFTEDESQAIAAWFAGRTAPRPR